MFRAGDQRAEYGACDSWSVHNVKILKEKRLENSKKRKEQRPAHNKSETDRIEVQCEARNERQSGRRASEREAQLEQKRQVFNKRDHERHVTDLEYRERCNAGIREWKSNKPLSNEKKPVYYKREVLRLRFLYWLRSLHSLDKPTESDY